jgi:hypothetical protein
VFESFFAGNDDNDRVLGRSYNSALLLASKAERAVRELAAASPSHARYASANRPTSR